MKIKKLGGFLLLMCLNLHTGALMAKEPSVDVHVDVKKGPHGLHSIEGQFYVNSSSQTAWIVLTDYDRLSSFVSSIKLSRQLRETNRKLVEQTMSGQAAFFRKKVHLLLEINEIPFEQLAFDDISKKSFKLYNGKWRIKDNQGELQITYHLDADPNFFSPGFITINAFRKNVKVLLEEVRNEILKRNG